MNPKIKNIIMNYDIETMMAIKSSFQSNEFQWSKTNDPRKAGTIVTVRDVLPGRNGRFLAVLSDGSQMDTDAVSSDLMMITDDQPRLSMAEIQSINYIPSLTEDIQVAPEIPAEFANTVKEIAPVARPAEPVNQTALRQQVSVDPSDLFGMFSLEDTDLNLAVRIKLPSKSLLKMMYANSKNKEEFLTKLSNYINNSITVDAIKKTMKKTLSASPKQKGVAAND
mgnify:CR=1 FL=1